MTGDDQSSLEKARAECLVEKRRLKGDIERLKAKNALLELQVDTGRIGDAEQAPPRTRAVPPSRVGTEDGQSAVSIGLEWSGDMDWADSRDQVVEMEAAHRDMPDADKFPPL